MAATALARPCRTRRSCPSADWPARDGVAGVQGGGGLAEVAADVDVIDEDRDLQAPLLRLGLDGGELLLVRRPRGRPAAARARGRGGSASSNAAAIMSSMLSVTDADTHLSRAFGPGCALRRAGGAAMSSGWRTAGVSRRRRRSRPSS